MALTFISLKLFETIGSVTSYLVLFSAEPVNSRNDRLGSSAAPQEIRKLPFREIAPPASGNQSSDVEFAAVDRQVCWTK